MQVYACAVCLATNVRMHNMKDCGVLQTYRILSRKQGIDDQVLELLCWECTALLKKIDMFRRKCERAYQLLQNIYSTHNVLSEHLLNEIDRSKNGLTSTYALSEISLFSTHDSAGRFIKIPENGIMNDAGIIKFEKVELEEAEIHLPEPSLLNDIKSEDEADAQIDDPAIDPHDNHSFEFDDTMTGSQNLRSFQLDDDFPIARMKSKVSGDRRKDRNTVIKKGRKRKKVLCTTTSQHFRATEILLTPEEAKKVYSKRKKLVKLKRSHMICSACFLAFKDEKAFKRHQMKHDPSKGDYECDACRMRFKSRGAIRIHISVHHTKKYICNICSKVSYTREIARHHFRVHESRGPALLRRKKKKKVKKVKTVKTEEFNTTTVILTQEQMMAVIHERQNEDGYSSARFKCTLCYKTFNEPKPYSNHMLKHDPASGPLECDICKIRVRTRRKLYKHISCNHMKKYTCNACSHVCYNRATALKHFAWHRGVVYTCHICGATTMKMSTHLSHLRIKHPSQHICGDCGQSFVSKMGLYHHAEKMHLVKQDSDAAKQVDAAGPYCDACDVQFASAAAWTRHILISPKHEHEKQALNGCRVCGERFSSSAELKRHHKDQHKRSKRYDSAARLFPTQCVQCEEIMSSTGMYWQHFRQKHTGKDFPLSRSSFICEYCGNWFKHKSTLEIHARSHVEADKRTHQCSECPKRFVKPESLARHARSHTAGERFACDVCS